MNSRNNFEFGNIFMTGGPHGEFGSTNGIFRTFLRYAPQLNIQAVGAEEFGAEPNALILNAIQTNDFSLVNEQEWNIEGLIQIARRTRDMGLFLPVSGIDVTSFHGIPLRIFNSFRRFRSRGNILLHMGTDHIVSDSDQVIADAQLEFAPEEEWFYFPWDSWNLIRRFPDAFAFTFHGRDRHALPNTYEHDSIVADYQHRILFLAHQHTGTEEITDDHGWTNRLRHNTSTVNDNGLRQHLELFRWSDSPYLLTGDGNNPFGYVYSIPWARFMPARLIVGFRRLPTFSPIFIPSTMQMIMMWSQRRRYYN